MNTNRLAQPDVADDSPHEFLYPEERVEGQNAHRRKAKYNWLYAALCCLGVFLWATTFFNPFTLGRRHFKLDIQPRAAELVFHWSGGFKDATRALLRIDDGTTLSRDIDVTKQYLEQEDVLYLPVTGNVHALLEIRDPRDNVLIAQATYTGSPRAGAMTSDRQNAWLQTSPVPQETERLQAQLKHLETRNRRLELFVAALRQRRKSKSHQ